MRFLAAIIVMFMATLLLSATGANGEAELKLGSIKKGDVGKLPKTVMGKFEYMVAEVKGDEIIVKAIESIGKAKWRVVSTFVLQDGELAKKTKKTETVELPDTYSCVGAIEVGKMTLPKLAKAEKIRMKEAD